jgi:uncharacterized protein YndB with AHSA1/START domain
MLPTILIILLAVVVLLLLLAALMKKEYSIAAEIMINRPKDQVFNYIKSLRNQEFYSKWIMADPKIQLEYRGLDGTVGSTASWKSEVKNVGVGEQEITKIIPGEGYDAEIRFEKPFKGISQAVARTLAISDTQTKYINTFHTKTPFPMNIMIPMIRKMLKKDMEENAGNLKRILESQ